MSSMQDFIKIKEFHIQDYIKELKEIVGENKDDYIVCCYSAHILHDCTDYTECDYYIDLTYTLFCRPNNSTVSSRVYKIENADFDNIAYTEMYGLKVTTQEQTLKDLCKYMTPLKFYDIASERDLKMAIHKYLETHSKSGLIRIRMTMGDAEAKVFDRVMSEIDSI